jgi:septation ring formation regulator EzrA
MAKETEKFKPFSMDDLHQAMRARDFVKDQLGEVQRNIRVEEGKLRSYRDEEAKAQEKLIQCEANIRTIAKNLEGI